MHRASRIEPPPTASERKALLRALRDVIGAHAGEFCETIARDFGWRSHDETQMTEVVPALTLIRDALANLDRWMRPEARGRSIAFWPARNRVYWPDRVTVAIGGSDTAQALCALPFDHIFFTGSTTVGKLVMQAAAQNLTPVTLELGGKSPAIVHGDCDHAVAARRMVRGKLLNAGQTCIAPDYALVHSGRVDEFVRLLQEAATQLYPRLIDNADYTSIVNRRHYDRLVSLVADARAKGARLVTVDPARELPADEIGATDVRKIAPVVATGVTDDMTMMGEEIFGPVLPVVAYDTLEEAVAYVNARPRPLALYYFDSDGKRVDQVMRRTASGGASVNDTVLHFAQEGLPFGGIGPSGMGAYHGRDGFRTFSHGKGVFLQSRWTLTELAAPPYGPRFRRMIRFAAWRNGGWRRHVGRNRRRPY